MAFIKAQKIVYDESGRIISGSASIVDAIYVQTGARAHSRQQVREKLGKVLYLSEDRKSGIFLSPTRGLIEYDAISNSFSPVKKKIPASTEKYSFHRRRSTLSLAMLTCC